MSVALYARVSTQRQQQAQTIEQQIERLQAHAADQGWAVEEAHIFRDDGYSGSRLNRPGLDRLRDQVRLAVFDRVLITAPDRLARNFVHQMVILEELEQQGCGVEFLDRPMSDDPHDQLVLQIRGAVAEYEQTLIRGIRPGCASTKGKRRSSARFSPGIPIPRSVPVCMSWPNGCSSKGYLRPGAVPIGKTVRSAIS